MDILIWYALNGEADDRDIAIEKNAERETISINTLISQDSAFHTRGINHARGKAWEALGSVLWKFPEVENRVWDAIEIALDKETLISVRCCMMEPITALFNMNKKRFCDSIHRLVLISDSTKHQNKARRLSPLTTYRSIHLFPYIFYWLPDLADELTTQLLRSGDRTKELIGAWLIFCESFRNDEFIDRANTLSSNGVDHRRLLAGVASDVIRWAENRHRAESLLKKFFFDEDKHVRNQAATVFNKIQPGEVELYSELSVVFLKSPAFPDNGFSFLRVLENATCDVLDLVIDATQQVINDIVEKGNQNVRRDTDLYGVKDLLQREYTSSESNPGARKRILDLIDLMFMHEIYGADSIVTTHDRW